VHTRLHDLVFPEQSNHHGTLFGGAALAMLDKLAFILASRQMRRTLVTASVSQLDFLAPVRSGDLAEASGTVVRRGRRSIEIEAELVGEDLATGRHQRCLAGRFVMVAQGEAPLGPVAGDCPPAAGQVRVAELVLPGQTNHRGIVHGAAALAWLSKAALVAASRDTRRTLVMASSDRLDFVAPARSGDIVEITAQVVRRGRRSVRVETTMAAESPLSGERRLCTRAGFVFVAIDADGRPVPLGDCQAAPIPHMPEPPAGGSHP
jgi:acyl-CoA hydrolase